VIVRAKEQPMIIEGRTITTVAEMLEFCNAAVEQTRADPSTIRLHIPQMRVTETTLRDGRKVYDVRVASVG
jgi:hypothetical protein